MKQAKRQILQFDLFLKEGQIIHGMSTRQGGVSQGLYNSLNMGWGLGDDPAKVRANYHIFAKELGIPPESYTLSDQVHQAKIAIIGQADRGNGFTFAKRDHLKGVDGLMTRERGIGLTIFSADCVPLIFYDPRQEVIGAAHSGWRGSLADIAGAMVKQMMAYYSSRPQDILVGIGPCISRANFEVGRDVKKEFENKGKYDILNKVFYQKNSEKYLLDLRKYIQYSLESQGILPDHIETSQACTYGQPDLFFSHRRDGLKRGSHIMVIYLKPGEEA